MSDTAIMEMESTSPNIPRRNATSAVGIDKESEYSLYDVLINEENFEKVITSTKTKNLTVCPSKT